ncbi:MAG: hypothetical protein J7494_08885 [Sphingobium sp.]|nr:hypothetical protein [Sphingobium sp.]
MQRSATPALLKPEINFRLSRLLGLRTNTSARDASPVSNLQPRVNERAMLQSLSAMVDLYPLGGGLRVSAGVGVDQGDSEASLVEQGRAEPLPSSATVPAFTVGYGGNIKGPISFAVDGGVRLLEVPRRAEVVPRLTGNAGVSRAYPVVRFSLARAF